MSAKPRTSLTLKAKSATFSTYVQENSELIVVLEQTFSFDSEFLLIDENSVKLFLSNYQAAFQQPLREIDVLIKDQVLIIKSEIINYRVKFSKKKNFSPQVLKKDISSATKEMMHTKPHHYFIAISPKLCTPLNWQTRAYLPEELFYKKPGNYLLSLELKSVSKNKVITLKNILKQFSIKINKFFDHIDLASSVLYPHDQGYFFIQIDDIKTSLIMKNKDSIIERKVIDFGSATYIKAYMDAFKINFTKARKLFTLNCFYNEATFPQSLLVSAQINLNSFQIINQTINDYLLHTIHKVLKAWKKKHKIATWDQVWAGDLKFLPDFENATNKLFTKSINTFHSYNKDLESSHWAALKALAHYDYAYSKLEETYTLPLNLLTLNHKFLQDSRR